MNNKLITVMCAGLLVVMAGCAPATTRIDAKFGDAVNKAKAQQIINPDAAKNTDPVAGIDGQAAKAIVDRYQKAYESPTPASSGSVGAVGSAGSTLK